MFSKEAGCCFFCNSELKERWLRVIICREGLLCSVCVCLCVYVCVFVFVCLFLFLSEGLLTFML